MSTYPSMILPRSPMGNCVACKYNSFLSPRRLCTGCEEIIPEYISKEQFSKYLELKSYL